MYLSERRLNRSILKNQILNELNFILKNFKILNEGVGVHDYRNAVNMVLDWAITMGAYNIDISADDPKSYRLDPDPLFYEDKDSFLSAPGQIVESAREIISDENVEYWAWASKEWVNWQELRKKNNSLYPKGGVWQIARVLASWNSSSRAAIERGDMDFSFGGWIGRKLTFFTYYKDDWKNVETLLKNGRYLEAVTMASDLLSVIDPTGLADIITGILLCIQGNWLAGILTMGFGFVNAGLLIADIISFGGTAGFHAEWLVAKQAIKQASRKKLESKSQRALTELVYGVGSRSRIAALKKSKSKASQAAGEALEKTVERGEKILAGKSEGEYTVRDLKKILQATGPAKEVTNPISESTRRTLIELAKKEAKTTAAAAVLQSPMAAYIYNSYVGYGSWDTTRNDIIKDEVQKIYNEMCKVEPLKNYCPYVDYKKDTMQIIPKQKEHEIKATILKNQLEKRIKDSGLLKKFGIKELTRDESNECSNPRNEGKTISVLGQLYICKNGTAISKTPETTNTLPPTNRQPPPPDTIPSREQAGASLRANATRKKK